MFGFVLTFVNTFVVVYFINMSGPIVKAMGTKAPTTRTKLRTKSRVMGVGSGGVRVFGSVSACGRFRRKRAVGVMCGEGNRGGAISIAPRGGSDKCCLVKVADDGCIGAGMFRATTCDTCGIGC